MPGPVSDSYDPEWGTGEMARDIADELHQTYDKVTKILGDKPPMDIRQLVNEDEDMGKPISAKLSEKRWRLIRFALERAGDTL